MGFSSIADFTTKALQGGQQYNYFWRYVNNTDVSVKGRWHVASPFRTLPIANSVWGELVQNGTPSSATTGLGWVLGAGWTLGAGYATKAAGSASAMTQSAPCVVPVNGRTYRTVYTIASYGGSGAFNINIGGTLGTNRTASGTYTENVVAGVGGAIAVQGVSTVSGRISVVSVIEERAFTQYADNRLDAIFHGGNVAPATKHVLEMGIQTPTATLVASAWWLIDVLGVYPRIDATLTTVQTLTNPVALSRYTDGRGVMAFLTGGMWATASTFAMSYTNQANLAGQNNSYACLLAPATPAAGNALPLSDLSATGIFHMGSIPLAPGDCGIRSVQSVKFSVAGTGVTNLVLCRPILMISPLEINTVFERDYFNQSPLLPRIYDGAYLDFIFGANGAMVSGAIANGWIKTVWG